MTIIILAFTVTMLIMFVGLSLAFRPTDEQKAVHNRIVRIQAANTGCIGTSDHIGNYLTPLDSTAFGWLEDLIDQSRLARTVKTLLLQADSSSSVGVILVWILGLAAGAASLASLFTPFAWAPPVAGIGAGYLPIFVLKYRGRSRLDAFNKALPDAIDMMARSLRAGHSLAASLGIVAEQARNPVKDEFAEVFKQQNFGLPLREALMQLLDRIPSQDLRVVVTAILVQKDTGGNLVEILERTVNVVNERIRIQGEIKTHTAQGRLTGWILCALPVVMLVLINLINPGYSNVLLSDPFGQKLLGAGVALLIVGGLVIRAIINGIEV